MSIIQKWNSISLVKRIVCGPVFPGSNPGIPTHKPLIKDKVLLKLQF